MCGLRYQLQFPLYKLKICISYILLLQGGLKTVVWTDTLQSMFFLSAVVAVSIIGTVSVGGFSEVLRVTNEKGRIVLFK